MVFKPIPDRTRWEGLLAVLWMLLIDVLMLAWAVRRPTDWLQFVLFLAVALSAPVLLFVLYRTWAAFSLEYWVDRNAVIVRWANVRQIIPLTAIQQIIEAGSEAADQPRWYQWPLPWVRRGPTNNQANWVLCATRPLGECLLLDTGGTIFALSPQWRARFVEQIQESYQLGPAMSLKVTEVRTSFLRQWLGDNPLGGILLGTGLLGVLILFGLLMIQFPALPSPLTFRYTIDGASEVVRDKDALFILPLIGLITWLANGAWGMWMMARNESTGAYMLWGGAIVVQIFSVLALNSLIP